MTRRLWKLEQILVGLNEHQESEANEVTVEKDFFTDDYIRLIKNSHMIPHTDKSLQAQDWQKELSMLINDPEQLLSMLGLDRSLLDNALLANRDFQLRVTPSYASRIKKGDSNDPLLRQVLPIGAELNKVTGFTADPLAEKHASPRKGIIHKYRGRVLLVAATQCAINCRYCFRRHFPYTEHQVNRDQWDEALDYIRRDASIHEVILSGGDPLALADKQLSWLVEKVAAIAHVRRLRIHTRMPIVLPARVTPSLLQVLTDTRLKPVMVIHCNHAQEVDEQVEEAINRLRNANIATLNQSVLLKGVNDTSETLVQLSERLFEIGVIPYYLHLLDRVAGAAHFEVSENHAKNIYQQMMQSLSGYLVPKLVREKANALCKVPVFLYDEVRL